jgi:hypothetical protein
MATPEFAHGEAETIVARIRAEFRAAYAKQEAGDASGAARAEQKANRSLEALRARLERYLDRQIRQQIAFASPGEREDAIAELQYRVLIAVKDTGDSLSAPHWERRFNQCVQRKAIDICRPIQARYGYGPAAGGETKRGPREITFSALDAKNDGDLSSSRYVDRLPDTNAEREIEKTLGVETVRQLVARLGERERDNLRLWWRQEGGETWEAIGASEGLAPDTARKRAQSVLHALRKLVGAEPG